MGYIVILTATSRLDLILCILHRERWDFKYIADFKVFPKALRYIGTISVDHIFYTQIIYFFVNEINQEIKRYASYDSCFICTNLWASMLDIMSNNLI
jgi:hypothetical protein